ncbi:MAG TPA: Bcr/CflA family efflux MFS transporter, partial [Thermomicrobiales bacterium]|nr:Bcr/CflA family efflux MFS transporter [Thermomicrobiales bacterium]
LPALPAVSRDLGASMALTQVTLTAAILGLALGQVVAGPLSDRFGRRRPLLAGIGAFVVASLLCLVAPNVTALTVLRAAQGLAGAAGIVISLAIARDLFAGRALARGISLLMTINFLAPILAPVLGGQLLRFASWRGVFGALALIGVALLAASVFGLGETLPAERRQAGGIPAALRTFRGLLAERRFVGFALVCGFAFAAGIVYISVSPFVLETAYGLSPQSLSLLFGVNALGLAGMAQISARLTGRVAPQALLAWGVAGIAGAGAALLIVTLGGLGLGGVLASLFLLVASLGLVAPNATTLALADVDPGRAGSASALLGLLQMSIGAVIAPLVGLAGATTAVPMAVGIVAFGLATVVAFLAERQSAPFRIKAFARS